MDFQALQNKFQARNLDNRTTWQAGWAKNKEALNDGYKEVFDKARQDRSVQEILKTTKTLITMTWATWDMPSDFLQPVTVYFKSGGVTDEIDREVFPYRFQRTSGTYKIVFDEAPNYPIYIEYIQKITDLSWDTDESVLPSEFDMDIVNYGMVEYHREQRDWVEVSNELQYAEWKIWETIDQFWLE